MRQDFEDLLQNALGKQTRRTMDDYQVDPTPTLTFGETTVTPKSRTEQSIIPIQETANALDAVIARQRAEIESLNENALADIRRIERELGTPAVQNLAAQPDTAAAVEAGCAGAGVAAFEGLAAALGETVFGQDDYLRKLAIAFKRPYVMGHTGKTARSSFLITGKAATGKRFSLTQTVGTLASRKVFASGEIAWMDLSLYPTPAEEKLFLQDVYAALAGSAEVVAFTAYEKCYSGFLTVVANLVREGKSPLASRYVMQNGKLIEAGNALVAEAVSTLSARGKYLVFLSEHGAERLAGSFGAPFVNALGDICATELLSEDALLQISKRESAALCARADTALHCAVAMDEAVHPLAIAAHATPGCATGVLEFWQNAYIALAQAALESDTPLQKALLTLIDGDLVFVIDGTQHTLTSLLPQAYTGELAQIKAELADIVGLADVKEYILQLENNFAMQQRRKAAGLKTAAVSMHMIFTGNPGTGKTTIARLVSRYLKAIGVLTGGQLVEVTRAELVGKYVGHTAPLTTSVLQSAIGGVLFIDEAYSLYRGKDDAFGLEAIDTLVKGMEDHRENLLVILAGYSKEMAQFLTANSGLKSRFPNIITFADYTATELLEITKLQAKSKGYTLASACDAQLLPYYEAVQAAHAREAGNGRFARNKLEEAILRQAGRAAADPAADLSLLLAEDFILNDFATSANS